jgi:hypothetical protein
MNPSYNEHPLVTSIDRGVSVSATWGRCHPLAVLLQPARAKSDTILSGDKTKPRREAGLTFQTRANF